MFMLMKILIGLIAPVLFTALLFLFNPILGVLSTIWFIGVAIYAIKKVK